MSTFSVPKGDPDALRRAVSKVASLATTVGETRADKLATLGGQAAVALPVARVAAFAASRSEAASGLGGVGLSLVTIGDALSDWADALETAQDTISSQADKHESAETSWSRAKKAGDTDLADEYHDDMTAATKAADRAYGVLDDARRRVVKALGGELDLWAPGADATKPVEAWKRATVSNSPSELTLDVAGLVAVYKNPDSKLAKDVVAKAVKAGSKSYALYGVLKYHRAPALALKAEEEYLKARQTYQAINSLANPLDPAHAKAFAAAEKALGKAIGNDVPADLRQAQWLYKQSRGFVGEAKALERASAFAPEASAAQIVGKVGRFETAMRPIRAVMPFASKVLGPIGVAAGVWEIYETANDDTMSGGDKAVHYVGGGATVVGGALVTAFALGVAVTPVGAAVVAVAGVVAVGCWVYENRDAIADGAKKVGKWIGDRAKDIGDAVADGAKKVWKGLFG